MRQILIFSTFFLLIIPTQSFSQTLLTIDSSGIAGKDARNGSDGSSGYSSGSDGQDGTDAGYSSAGNDGGDINISIKEGKSHRGVVVIKGEFNDNGRRKSVDTKVKFGRSGYVYLKADGGKGGDGGTGGDGGDGASGYRGNDATRYSDGTDGGDGGDGGDAGKSTPGSDGGDGGNIKINVAEKDAHLLMLFEHSNRAGSGGASSSYARGGSGGYGGSGGSSYSWTERVYSHRDCSTSCNMVSDGNGGFDNDCSTSCHDVYRTEYHSNSGGSSGYSGSSGSGGYGDTSAGSSGRDGNYEVVVDGKSYCQRYELQLLGFNFRSNNGDGIFEPGEEVTVSNVEVANLAPKCASPTPTGYKAKVHLHDHRWVLSDGKELTVESSLKPGESYILPGTLKFKIADTTIHQPGDRFSERSPIQPLSYLTGVNRQFEEFNNPQSFQVTFPIEITPLYAPKTMAKGGVSRMFWRVRNISKKSIGESTEASRKIRTWIKTNGGQAASHVVMDSDGGLEFADGFYKEVAKLGPGQSTIIEGKMHVDRDAADYSTVTVRTGLELEKIDNEGNKGPQQPMNQIQLRDFDIRISRLYEPFEGADFLLVTNSQTRQEEIQGWDKMAKKLGLEFAVWDVSYYGFIDLVRNLKNDQSLLKDFKKKTIVMLNHEIDAGDGYSVPAIELASRKDFFKAMTSAGIGFYLVGSNRNFISELLLPPLTNGFRADQVYNSVEEFRAALAEDLSNKDEHGEGKKEVGGYKLLGDDAVTTILIKDVEIKQVMGAVNESNLFQESQKLLDELEDVHPHKDFAVLRQFRPVKKKGGMFKTWSLGDVFLRRIGGTGTGKAIALDIPETQFSTGYFPTSQDNVLGLFHAMRFQHKLDHLIKLMEANAPLNMFDYSLIDGSIQTQHTDKEYIEMLLSSMLLDLTYEFDVFVEQNGHYKDPLNHEYELYYLKKLTRTLIPKWIRQRGHGTVIGQGLAKLLTSLKMYQLARGEELDSGPSKLWQGCFDRIIDVSFDLVRPPLATKKESCSLRGSYKGETYKENSAEALHGQRVNSEFRSFIDFNLSNAMDFLKRDFNSQDKWQRFKDYLFEDLPKRALEHIGPDSKTKGTGSSSITDKRSLEKEDNNHDRRRQEQIDSEENRRDRGAEAVERRRAKEREALELPSEEEVLP